MSEGSEPYRAKLALTLFQKVVTAGFLSVSSFFGLWCVGMIKSINDTVTTASENKHELDERGEWMKLKNSTDARQDRTDATLAKNQSMLLCEIRKLKGEQCTIKFIEVEQ